MPFGECGQWDHRLKGRNENQARAQTWLRVLSKGAEGSGSEGSGNTTKPSGIVSTNTQKPLVSEIFGSHKKDSLCEFRPHEVPPEHDSDAGPILPRS